MNWDRIEGNWKEFKGKAQQQWGKLTNDDLDVIEGKRKELAGRLQQRYGYAKDQAEKEIDTWLDTSTSRSANGAAAAWWPWVATPSRHASEGFFKSYAVNNEASDVPAIQLFARIADIERRMQQLERRFERLGNIAARTASNGFASAAQATDRVGDACRRARRSGRPLPRRRALGRRRSRPLWTGGGAVRTRGRLATMRCAGSRPSLSIARW